jgi:hypothetical protein
MRAVEDEEHRVFVSIATTAASAYRIEPDRGAGQILSNATQGIWYFQQQQQQQQQRVHDVLIGAIHGPGGGSTPWGILPDLIFTSRVTV